MYYFPYFKGDCTFEEDACGWTNALPVDALDDFDWARQYSYSVSGPATDHTKGTKEGKTVVEPIW